MLLSKKSILVTYTLCFFFALFSKPVTVLEETQDYLRIKFSLPEWSVKDQGSGWQTIICEGSTAYTIEGYPKLPAFSEALGIPIDGDINLQVISQKKQIFKKVNIAPTEKIVLSGDNVDYQKVPNLTAYNSKDLFPSFFVNKGTPAYFGNRRVIALQIFPFQYIASAKELQVTTEAEILVNISGTKSKISITEFEDNILDRVGDDFFLNNRTSSSWRKPQSKVSNTPIPKNSSTTVNELQLIVDQEGIYKITYSYLASKMQLWQDSLGIQYSWNLNNVDPRYLELYDENGPIPIHFSGESDGSFDNYDYFEFFGDRHYGDTSYQDDYTARNVYTLKLVDHFGARLAVENGGLTVSNPYQYIVPDAYQQTIHLEEQLIPDKLGYTWDSNQSYYREDLWFWKKITAPNLDIIPFELQYPKDSTIRTFSCKMSLFGLTKMENNPGNVNDHRATVRLNQSLINTHSWLGQTEKIFQNSQPLPNSFLRHGTNYFYISLPGDTPMADREQVLVDYAELTYWREYKTNSDYIQFTKPSNRPLGLYQFEIEGFSSNQISVYKIGSSIFNNMQIEPFSINGGAPWTVTFQDSVISNDVKYIAVNESKKLLPIDFRANIPSDLKSTANAYDFLILTKREFTIDPGTLLFKEQWENQGYTVKIVDVQDIFDEFNSGIRSAEAIKDFLTYAYYNWSSPQIKHVLLLGEGTDDERDNSTNSKYNIIPIKKIWTSKLGATASDNWYGCILGNDPLPEINVFRINIWRADQIMPVAQKTQQYLTNPNYNNLWHSHVTLTAGGKIDDPDDIFSQQSEIIRRRSIPEHYRVSRVYTNTQTVSSDYFGGTFTLKSKIDEGTIYLQFMGHGGGRTWADYNLFNFNDIATLNNTNYPVIVSLSCYASAFETPGASSISEALVVQPAKGAIATVGFSGLGYLDQDLDFGLALTEALFKYNFTSLADAVAYTKAKVYISVISSGPRQALIEGCALLGDASVKIIKPQNNLEVHTDKIIYAYQDTIRVTTVFPVGSQGAKLYVMKPNESIINVPYNVPINPVTHTFASSYVIPSNLTSPARRKIYVAGFSLEGEYIGTKEISIGRGLVTHHTTIPNKPAWNDSIRFQAKVINISRLNTIVCKVRPDSFTTSPQWLTLPMLLVSQSEGLYETPQGLPRYNPGKELIYKYVATDSTGTVYESGLRSLVVAGPELVVRDIQFIPQNDSILVKTLVQNIGNTSSLQTDIRLTALITGQPTQVLYHGVLLPLSTMEQRWITIPIDTLFTSNVTLEVRVNVSQAFPEWSYFTANNVMSIQIPMNYYAINSSGAVINSLDHNLSCEIPIDLVPANHTSIFYIKTLTSVTPNNQPDVLSLKLASGIASIPYEIKTLDNTLVDSLGVFRNGKRLKLTFYYSATDSLTQQFENENSYKIYRWEPIYRKWVLQGGNISTTLNKVIFEVNRQGIYTLLRNKDRTRPSIDVNVQDQEFTVGGYISGKGIISLLLSDANGIDVFDNVNRLYLNGIPIPPDQWVQTINTDNINRIPIKYQLNLTKGTYNLVIDCKDVNGNFNSREIQFIVNDKFDVIKFANYPNPVESKTQDPKNSGRTRFTYVLTDDADEVTIKIYTVSGRLVKTFKNLPTGVGYHEFPRTVYGWDCTDESGFFLANGVYFYRIIAKKGNKTIEKTQKMAILK